MVVLRISCQAEVVGKAGAAKPAIVFLGFFGKTEHRDEGLKATLIHQTKNFSVVVKLRHLTSCDCWFS